MGEKTRRDATEVEHSEERRERREREMSAIFDGYEREYCELSTQLARKTNMLGSLSGDSKSQKVSDINNDLSEAEALVSFSLSLFLFSISLFFSPSNVRKLLLPSSCRFLFFLNL